MTVDTFHDETKRLSFRKDQKQSNPPSTPIPPLLLLIHGRKREKEEQETTHQHPNDQTSKPTTLSDLAFKPSFEVKRLQFGGQFIVKSFIIHSARPLEFLRLLSLLPTLNLNHHQNQEKANRQEVPSSSQSKAYHTFLNISSRHEITLPMVCLAWGPKKSKVVVFVFEFENMEAAVDRVWLPEIPLGEVNKKLTRGQARCKMARFKFRKGAITFYVYAVRRIGNMGFSFADDLRTILQSVVALNDCLDQSLVFQLPCTFRRHNGFDWDDGCFCPFSYYLRIKLSFA
ncbi:unnamed protein product [Coffea canephora]|uniref:DUF7851 domain-containing protein n=1 Tax=Coffea canephora TaxID=49390 RepID=A0A068V5F6_COFCA|nr:unnamed protein product [Coffea canephora]